MQNQLKKLDENFEILKKQGVTDSRFYIGEVSETTADEFAKEANLVLEAYINGKVKPVAWSCPSIN